MPGEFDPAEELGLGPRRYLLLEPRGFLLNGDINREICSELIPGGDRLYDVIERYDYISGFVRDPEGPYGSSARYMIPFLKVYGATERSMFETAKKKMRFTRGAKDSCAYLSELMNVIIRTGMYDQALTHFLNVMGSPGANICGTDSAIDPFNLDRIDSEKIKEIAGKLSSLEVSSYEYPRNTSDLIPEDTELFRKTRRALERDMPLQGAVLFEGCKAINSLDKAWVYADKKVRDQDGTVYIGSNASDSKVMGFVNSDSGMTISFNGTDAAVRACRIAVVSDDSLAGTFFAQMFNSYGYQHTLETAEDWSRSYLDACEISDRRIIDRILSRTGAFPKVFVVDRNNVEDVVEKNRNACKKIKAGRSGY